MPKIDLTSRLDPQMARAMAKSQELAPGFERIHELPIEQIRRLYRQERRFWNQDRPELPKVVEREIAGPVGPVTPTRPNSPASSTGTATGSCGPVACTAGTTRRPA